MEPYRTEGGAALVSCPRHRAVGAPLVRGEATAQLAAASTRRWPKASPFARAYSKWLFPLIDVRDWGARRTAEMPAAKDRPVEAGFYVTTNNQWDDWHSGRRLLMRFRPRELPIYRLDGHTRPGKRLPAEKLLVTVGRHEWLAMVMVDVDAHDGEADAPRAFDWARDTYFGGDLYDEPADRGHHGYLLLDRRGVPDAELNALLHRAHVGIGELAKAAGHRAPVEIKGRVTLLDGRGLILTRGGLFAPPRLPDGWDSLRRLRGSTVHPLDVLHRIIADAGQLRMPPAGPTAAGTTSSSSEVEDRPSGQAPGRGEGASGTHTIKPSFPSVPRGGPYELKLKVCHELARRMGRVPTVAEVSAEYDPLRNHESDTVRVRNIEKAVRACARTFAPSKAGGAGGAGVGWCASRESLLQAVRTHVSGAMYDKIGMVAEEEVAVALYLLTRNSFARQRDVDHQWTFGYDAIQAMFHELLGHGVKREKIPLIKSLLVASGLADCFDPAYQVGVGGRKGIAIKYHIGKRHPRYVEFLRHCESHGIHVRRAAEQREADGQARCLAGCGAT